MKRFLSSPIFYFLLLSLPTIFWVSNNEYILGGDFGWPQFFDRFLYFSFFSWDESVNFGYNATRQTCFLFPFNVYGFLLEKVFSGTITQKIIVYISFFFSGYGFYLLSRNFGLTKLASFISGFFYMYNPYPAIVAWNPSYGLIFPFYCFLPLNLFLFFKFIQSDNIYQKALFILLSGLTYINSSNPNPANFAIFIGFVFYSGIFLNKNINRKSISNVFQFVFLYLLIHSFWIIPLVYDLNNQYSAASNAIAGLISDSETVLLNSVKLINSFGFTGFWAMNGEEWGNRYYTWFLYQDTNIYKFYSFIIPVLMMFPLVINNKFSKRTLNFLMILFIIGIVLNSGSLMEGLTKKIADIFYSLPFFQRAFRSVFLKFGVILVIPGILLASIGFEQLTYKLSNKFRIILMIVIIVLISIYNAKPFFNGEIVKKHDTKLPGYRVEIPYEYYEFSKLDKEVKYNFRLLSVPISPSYNHLLKWKNSGFNGGDFLRLFASRPVIYQNGTQEMMLEIINCINEYDNNYCEDLFSYANIGEVFIHKDIPVYMIKRNYYKTKIKHEFNGFITKHENQYFKVLKKIDTKITPLVFSPKEIIESESLVKGISQKKESPTIIVIQDELNKKQYKGRESFTIPKSIEYKKINPSKYRVRLRGVKDKVILVLSTDFDPRWNLYLGNYKSENQYLIDKKYSIGKLNKDYQATNEELLEYIKNNEISKGTISEFVSKKINGTIQNNNLDDGLLYETWIKRGINANDQTHIKVNGFANAWILDVESLCNNNKCLKNQDSKYDMEIIIEYNFQKIVYLSFFISIISVLILCFILIWYFVKYYMNLVFSALKL